MEIIDIVDANDKVIGSAPKDEVREKGLRCRVSFVILLNAKNELFLQQRKATKKTYPLYWSGSAVGHVQSGESYFAAAKRELEEELGVQTDLREIGKFTSESDHEIVTVFVGRHEGPYTLEEAAIEQAKNYSPAQLHTSAETMKMTSYLILAIPMVEASLNTELFDLIDEHDQVIGTTDRATSHANQQLHRLVAVYVFNEGGELYVQVHKASGGLYDNSVGGHVSSGEAYPEAAKREAAEELDIRQPLNYLSTFYSDEGKYQHMFGLFECVANKDWIFIPNDEVAEIIPMKLDDIRKIMETNPEKCTSGFINTMKEYVRIKGL
jgi:isopentenyl-diphosphate delta-isomerase